MTVKFYLRDNNASKDTAIFAFVFIGGLKVKLYVGKSVHPQDWNGEKQRVKKSNPNYSTINESLDEFKAKITQTYKAVRLEFGDDFSEIQFKEAYLNISPKKNSKGEKDVKKKLLFELFEEFVNSSSRASKSKGKTKTDSTKRQYHSTLNILKEFTDNTKVQNINQKFLQGFSDYLFDEKENQDTSVANRVTHLKIFLKWIEGEKKIKIPKDYSFFSISKSDSIKVALSIQEINKIQNLDLNNPYLIHSRDLFLLQFYTGRRYSDIQLLRKEHFRINEEGRAFFDFHDEKTDKKISVPLTSYVMDLIKKYDMDFKPTALKTQIKNIRTLCQMAGVNESIEKLTYYNKTVQREYYEKWELVGTHTARRSFITYAHSKGLTVNEISELTGQTLAVVQKYIIVSDFNKVKSIDKVFS